MLNALKKGPVEAEWTGGFWKERWETCRDRMVPHMWSVLADKDISHCWQNFLIADGQAEGEHSGPPFHDGDLYKWLEGAIRVYGKSDNREWLDRIDEIIATIARVQRPDGYIFTYDAIQKRNKKQYEALGNDLNFEVYNLGHLMTAGVMHHTMTGKTTLLACAEKAAAYLGSQFADLDTARARTAICPSHYMGLAQLHAHTGNEDYIELLNLLIQLRDRVPNGTDDNQDRIPLKSHREIVGHGVRSTYLYAGVTDLYMQKKDEDYRTVLEAVWNDLVSKKIYITGGCGALYDGVSPYGVANTGETQTTHQAFGRAYELPNTAGYNETCASVGNYLWNFRMAQAFGEGKYGDYMEKALYNSILSGIDLDGDAYFYTNSLRCQHGLPYQLKWGRHREPYLTSFCCPPNVVRTLAGTPDKICVPQQGGVAFLLYGAARIALDVESGGRVGFAMRSDYPWDGEIEIEIDSLEGADRFPIALRKPEWASRFAVSVNGEAADGGALGEDGFITLKRAWKVGDTLKLSLPMDVTVVESHPMVEESRNHVAITRGPLVYCLETADLPEDCQVGQIYIDPTTEFTPVTEDIGGSQMSVLKGELWVDSAPAWTGTQLYRPHGTSRFRRIAAKLVPYFAWDNRQQGEMSVWLPILPKH